MTRLHDLYEQQGQSPWLDNLRRDFLTGGTLEKFLEEGIRGITSNPTIFANAMDMPERLRPLRIVMNLADHEGDLRAGKRTLVVKLGPGRARRAFALAQIAGYAAVVGLAACRALPGATAFAMMLTAPLAAWLAWRLLGGAPRDRVEAEAMAIWASIHAALLAAAATFGLLVSAPPGADRLSVALSGGILGGYAALTALQVPRRREGSAG